MARRRLNLEELTYSVIGAFFEVYNVLGFGFLEHIYVQAMERELRRRGHAVGREVGVRIMYKGEELGTQPLDMVVSTHLWQIQASMTKGVGITKRISKRIGSIIFVTSSSSEIVPPLIHRRLNVR